MSQIYESHKVSRIVTIHENSLKPRTYYGTIIKKKINVNNLIADIDSTNQGIAGGQIERATDLLLAQIRKKMSESYAIELEKIGVLYVGLNGSISNSHPSPGELPYFVPKFSPDETLCSEVRKIDVEKIITVDNSPLINSVSDSWNEDGKNSLTIGKVAKIAGKRIKLLGESSGIFFAPC